MCASIIIWFNLRIAGKMVKANILVYYACCSVLSPLQSVREKYQSNEYQEDRQKQMLVFEEDEIVLDLPTDDSNLKVADGWKIIPLTYPQVKIKMFHIKKYAYCKVATSNLTCSDNWITRWQLHLMDPSSTGLSSLGQNIIHSSVARVMCG